MQKLVLKIFAETDIYQEVMDDVQKMLSKFANRRITTHLSREDIPDDKYKDLNDEIPF